MSKKADILVKESNAIARAQLLPASGSLWDERIITLIVARNTKDDTEFHDQNIDIKELATAEGLSASQRQEIDKAITRLTQSYFKITRANGDYMNYPIFARIGVENGVISGEINPELKEHYLELKEQFAMRSVPEFQALSSTYSQRLYRLLNSWYKTHAELNIKLSELHEMLQTPASFRANFKDFRIRVLEPAHREINTTAAASRRDNPLEFDWEPIKQGKQKVVAVRFTFRDRRREQALRVADKAHEILDMFKRIAGQDLPAEAL